jgi:hypothetical protein
MTPCRVSQQPVHWWSVFAPQTGDLHIQVAESNVMLGAQFEGLGVYPQGALRLNTSRSFQLQLQAQSDCCKGMRCCKLSAHTVLCLRANIVVCCWTG